MAILALKAIIGLGNPGPKYEYTRHNIGFLILDALAQKIGAHISSKENMELAHASINGRQVLLIKPQTFMNESGKVIPFLKKQGIKPEEILIIHDELELPEGVIKEKFGGSHKGHNGLKSIIGQIGPDFYRLRFGIGRPENKEEVPNYVLQKFKAMPYAEIEKAAETILAHL